MTRIVVLVSCLFITGRCVGQETVTANRTSGNDPVLQVSFNGNVNESKSSLKIAVEGKPKFLNGLNDQAISVNSQEKATRLKIPVDQWKLDSKRDFSVEFWIRTTMSSNKRAVILSTKTDLVDNSMKSQRQKGWTFFISHGTWGWNIGSGNRRVSYERTNGEFFRINNGRWHQLAMTYDSTHGLVRLYFDGQNWVTYNVRDSGNFEFGNTSPLTIGWQSQSELSVGSRLPVFEDGARQLQELVDEFNRIGLPPVTSDEFELLVSRPSQLLNAKIVRLKNSNDSEKNRIVEKARAFDLKKIEKISKRLMRSPYTVHQSRHYNEVALLFQLYSLKDEKIEINERVMERLAKRERLSRPSFDMDELKLWNRLLSPEEVSASYARYFKPFVATPNKNLKTLVAGSWNIYHGGLHHSVEKDGWDSRQVIIDLLKRENIDVLMMQETYSSGDYIAAELGYYFATTIDWDNMFQGSNISVLSRYPIKEVFVPPKSAFMSVGTKVSLSRTQDIWVISNWFGMRNFEDVFGYHKSRFDSSDSIPVLFAGDFNAIPHSDGGTSTASRKLLNNGFIDAYRSFYPDVKKHPGFTHRSNRRIDQLYFKGKGLKHISTDVLSSWPSKFPADHYLIKSKFKLNYANRKQTK